LVKAGADLRGCDRDRRALFVERLPFFNVGSEQGRCKSSALVVRALN
jgi:hypothetical protein